MKIWKLILMVGAIVIVGWLSLSPMTTQAEMHTDNTFELTADDEQNSGGHTANSGQNQAQSRAGQSDNTELASVDSNGMPMPATSGIGSRVLNGVGAMIPTKMAIDLGWKTRTGDLPQTSESIGLWLIIIGLLFMLILGLSYLLIHQRRYR